MPERSAQVPYQAFPTGPGASPDTITRPEPRFDAHASPSPVGQSLEKAGGQLEQVGNEATALAVQHQGMINETLSTDAETQQLLPKLGELTGKYRSQEGLAAVSLLPQYTKDANDLFAQIRSSLPAGAAKSFDMMSQRHIASAISDANGYASQQIKAADKQSAVSLTQTAATRAGDLSVATNDQRFGETMGDIHHGIARQMQNEGWMEGTGAQQSPDGTLTFDGSENGQKAKAVYQDLVDKTTGIAWENRLHSLSDQNTLSAYNVFKQNRDQIPGEAQVKLDAYFTPKVRSAEAKNVADNVLNTVNSQYTTDLKSGALSNPNNLGNVKTQQGATNNTPDFVVPASATDGAALAASNIRKPIYQGLTLDQIGHKWTATGADDWVKNVSAASGIDPKTVPNLNDPGTLQKLLTGIATAEKSPQDRALFTPAVIQQGVQQALNGNASKAPLVTSQADYYRANYQQIVDSSLSQAQASHPDDPEYQQTVRAHVEQRMNDAIRQQELSYKADNDMVLQAFTGALSKDGKRPTSIAEMTAINPTVKQSWDRMQINNPLAAENIENKIMTQNASSKDTKEYGAAYWDLFKGVHNGTITDISQVYGHMGADGDLSMAGMKQLQDELKGDKDDGKLREQTFKTVRTLFMGSHDNMNIAYPEGEQDYAHAMTLMYKAEKDAQSRGVSKSDMYDPSNKEWIGNVAKPLAKNLEQRMASINARFNAGGGKIPAAGTPGGPPTIADRLEDKIYQSPNGPVKWTKQGWVKAPPPDAPVEKE